jgi:hypothetical protein
MPNLISLSARKIKPKGLNKSNKINENKLKEYFLTGDYENLSLLEKVSLKQIKEKLTLFYPGCGTDILTPLIYLEKILLQTKKAKFIFLDQTNSLGIVKTILDDIGVSFSERKNKIKFYWKDKLIDLEFIENNVFYSELPEFDIYFEKAFRIMKDGNQDYEKNIFNQLNKNGIIISDSGFQEFPLKRISVSQELSAYQEMIIGVK